jgi:hypothetical protein
MHRSIIEPEYFLHKFNQIDFFHSLHINYILSQLNFQSQNLVAYFTFFLKLFGHVFDN